ncbi:MAG: ROK family protein [Selenomonadaceae bacterium]|nr:ROK family protein [Selenomonadaceae bacterium]
MIETFKKIILAKANADIAMTATEDKISLKAAHAEGEINFYRLATVIVEMSVKSLIDGENKFYLHFELKDLAHAEELLAEMLDTLADIKEHHKLKILLCCTGGLTTGYFGDKLNEAARLLSLDFTFNAVPFPKLYTEGVSYDVILLAPQIAFQYQKVCAMLPDKFVRKIPPKIFAAYDVGAAVAFVQAELKKERVASTGYAEAQGVDHALKADAKILSIALMPFYGEARRTRIAYRIYQRGKVIHEERVIKGRFNVVRDIEDILDTVSVRCMKYDAVGIALPGIVRDGRLDLHTFIDPEFNLHEHLEQKYRVPIIIENNANAAALGYWAQQTEAQNMIFMSQPRGYTVGGQGIILNGKLWRGCHNVAGETKFVCFKVLTKDEWERHTEPDSERIYDMLLFQITAGIAVMDPELICVRSEMATDMEKIAARLQEYIPTPYLPKFRHVTEVEMSECIMLGQMLLCLEVLQSRTGS